MGMLIITGIWTVILIGIFVIGVAVDKLILKILDEIDKSRRKNDNNI